MSFSTLCMLVESRADLPEDGIVYKMEGRVVADAPVKLANIHPDRVTELLEAGQLYVLWGQKSRQFDELDGNWDGIRQRPAAPPASAPVVPPVATEPDEAPTVVSGEQGLVVRNNYKGFVFELRGANVDELYEAARLKWELTEHPIHKPGYAAAMAMLDQHPQRTRKVAEEKPVAPVATQGTLL